MMEQYNPSTYQRISNLLTVKDIADSIKISVSSTITVGELYKLYEQFGLFYNEYCLVKDDNEITSCLAIENVLDDLELDDEIADSIWPISPSMLISASTPLIDLPRLFEKTSDYFLITNAEITHSVSYRHLDKLPMRIVLFSLFMELDDGLLECLRMHSKKSDLILAINGLPPYRVRAIHRWYRDNNKGKDTDDPHGLLTHTNFSDKKELVSRFPKIRDHFPFDTFSDYERFFKKVQKLRNLIAHSDSILRSLEGPVKFTAFLADLEQSIQAVNDLNR